MTKILSFLLTLTASTQVFAQVGNRCTFRHTSAPGICKIAADCPQVKEQAQAGISPVICGFKDSTIPIVCCEGASFNNAEPNENSFLDTESSSPDTFAFPDESPSRKRISEQKCDEYSKLTTESVNVLALVTNAKPVTINVSKCDYDGVPLIVGGQPAAPGEFPFMAAVGFRDNEKILWNCGGTLISNRFVLTAGHCTSSRDYGSPVVVRLGDLNLYRNDDEASPIDYTIEDIILPRIYNRTQKYNDIALLKLAQQVTFTKYIRPACLWDKFQVNQKSAIATGWGKTDGGGDVSDKLLKVALKILDNQICNRTYQIDKKLPLGIIDTMLCAGELKGGKDTCQGDSGGPLLISKVGNPCVHYVIGITSFGKYCATANIPAVYTRVSEYVSWLERTVW